MRRAFAGGGPVSFNRGLVAPPGAVVRAAARLPRLGRPSLPPLAAHLRRLFALLIAVEVSIVFYRALDPRFSPVSGQHGIDVFWMVPALAGGAAVGACLVVTSASSQGIAGLAKLGLPGVPVESRAIANGLTWAAIAMLAVHFTSSAFDVLPGGHHAAGTMLGVGFGVGAFRLHHHAIEHEAYRTFNLVAMLLAVGSLASMSITPTGEWWTRNFSTLGTSNDLAAVCFNVALIVSGLGMAVLSSLLTRGLAHGPFALRHGARTVMRLLVVFVGVSLAGVGFVPIDTDTELHNAFALAVAAAFAALCLGVRFFAPGIPRAFARFSYLSLAVEAMAMVAYDRLGLFSLTVFEIVAFTLVFAWLIALVVATVDGHGDTRADAAAHPRRIRRPLPALAPSRRRFADRWLCSGRRRYRAVPVARAATVATPRGAARRRRLRRSRGASRGGPVESRHGYRHRRNRPQR
ncbi:hypothetical protein [Agromyces laixinhei]|uniref:hypothetical protein n=1 Tax=Agromyces laixinhei TaxID=2585717 RepID=UPI0012EE64B1|nr:hypothetical protein [Agromyces laixinhei]